MATERERQFTGKIKTKLPIYEKDSFKKLEFIVVSDEQYPQAIKFELNQTKCDLLNNFSCGDEVKLDFNIRGREWVDTYGKTLYFNSFVVWRISKIEKGYVVPSKEESDHVQYNFNFPPASEVFGDEPQKVSSEYEPDDLPF